MEVIHISEAEAIRNFAGVLAKVRAGAEVIIDPGASPVAILSSPTPPRRSMSETIRLAEEHANDLGYTPAMDAEYAADMEEIVGSRKPADRSAWD